MTRIQFLISPTGAPFFLAYNAGEFANVSDDVAEKLVKAKVAILAPERKESTVNTTEKKANPAAKTAESKQQTEKR